MFAGVLAAQYGQPGQYPRGQSPGNNGPGIPMPGRSKKTQEQQAAAQPRNYSGVIRNMDDKSIEVETTDTRTLTFQLSDKTEKPRGLKRGDGVDVSATQDKDGLFQAVSVKINEEVARKIDPQPNPNAVAQNGEPEEPVGPPPTLLVRPGPLYDDGDNGPPKLKRGAPPPQQRPPAGKLPDPSTVAASLESKEKESEPLATREPVKPLNPRQEFVEKARGVAMAFMEGLPNYICQELTTRYFSQTRIPNWSVVDVVGAEVVFENNKESYRNLTINGKPSKKPPEESGAWSTGELGSILASLFSPGSAAEFKYVQEATISHLPAAVYDFKVARPRSSWKISVPGQFIFPAYKGTVWIDKQSAHVLRIEMQATNVPEEFPRSVVETAVDYEYITLGTPEKFLLPVHAETLSCGRGTNDCDRNVIEFRNYHKFTGESTIKFNSQE